MASSNRQVPAALMMILMLLVAQSLRKTEAFDTCHLTCLLACVGGLPLLYPICIGGCLLSSCRAKPPASEDNLMQCKTGCITSNCMGPKHGPHEPKTKRCVISCAEGCENAFIRNPY